MLPSHFEIVMTFQIYPSTLLANVFVVPEPTLIIFPIDLFPSGLVVLTVQPVIHGTISSGSAFCHPAPITHRINSMALHNFLFSAPVSRVIVVDVPLHIVNVGTQKRRPDPSLHSTPDNCIVDEILYFICAVGIKLPCHAIVSAVNELQKSIGKLQLIKYFKKTLRLDIVEIRTLDGDDQIPPRRQNDDECGLEARVVSYLVVAIS